MQSSSDVQLGRAAAAAVSRPRHEPADSFVLHAPLELAARFGLLPWVHPHGRDAARQRIDEVATQFESFGPEVSPPRRLRFDSPAEAAGHLVAAIGAGDLDDVDAAASALGDLARARELPGLLASAVVPSLAAAGHAPIFLHLLPRVAPRGELPVSLLRPLARELARHPDWKVTWFDGDESWDGPADLAEAIRSLPHLGINGGTFIFPTMSQVESSGVAAGYLGRALRDASVADAGRTICRLAAHSMLVEPDEHAPYGWTHALTMSQAAVSVAESCAEPRSAVAVAATFLAGFRTSLGTVSLDTAFAPERPTGDLTSALADAPASAPAAVWYAGAGELAGIRTILATEASRRHDAHLVKYTLACLDAADDDPAAARTYLAAAAKLLAFWIEHPDPLD